MNEGNEDEAVVEGVEEVWTMTVVRLDTQGLRHQDVVVPPIGMIIEVHLQGVRLIHIFLGVEEDGIQTIGGTAHQASHILLFVLLLDL